MFHHVVMLHFRDTLSEEDCKYINDACDTLRELPGVITLQFVSNCSERAFGYTHAFVSSFVDSAAHDHYQQTPLHAPLKQKIKEITDQVVVLDYETP
ncbi:Dabb family protein [Castellaniella sp.]|uniref:Dabb family protein n=1 Tax=Castellaniella sp. TaxID=1955812 RepID=UPI0035622A3B